MVGSVVVVVVGAVVVVVGAVVVVGRVVLVVAGGVVVVDGGRSVVEVGPPGTDGGPPTAREVLVALVVEDPSIGVGGATVAGVSAADRRVVVVDERSTCSPRT